MFARAGHARCVFAPRAHCLLSSRQALEVVAKGAAPGCKTPAASSDHGAEPELSFARFLLLITFFHEREPQADLHFPLRDTEPAYQLDVYFRRVACAVAIYWRCCVSRVSIPRLAARSRWRCFARLRGARPHARVARTS